MTFARSHQANQSAPAALCLDSATVPTSILRSTVPARREGERFRKEILRVGEWVHPEEKWSLAVDGPMLAEIATQSNRYLSDGHRVPVPARHSRDPRDNMGFVTGFEVDEQHLYAIIEPGRKYAESLGDTIRDVSAALLSGYTDSEGRHYSHVIEHVACTSYPVIAGQSEFVAMDVDGEQQQVPVLRREFQQFTDAEQACISDKISRLRDEGVEQDQAVARAIQECAPEKARAMDEPRRHLRRQRMEAFMSRGKPTAYHFETRLGGRLRSAIEGRDDVTIASLSERTRIDGSRLAEIVLGMVEPTAEELSALGEELDIKAEEFQALAAADAGEEPTGNPHEPKDEPQPAGAGVSMEMSRYRRALEQRDAKIKELERKELDRDRRECEEFVEQIKADVAAYGDPSHPDLKSALDRVRRMWSEDRESAKFLGDMARKAAGGDGGTRRRPGTAPLSTPSERDTMEHRRGEARSLAKRLEAAGNTSIKFSEDRTRVVSCVDREGKERHL